MIAIAADIHAANHPAFRKMKEGMNTRLLATLEALDWMADAAESKGADALLILGDLFHTRPAIDTVVRYHVSAFLQRCTERFREIVLLVGNHDMSEKGDGSNNLSCYHSGSVRVVSSAEVVRISGLNVGLLPYTENTDEVTKAFKKFARVDFVGAHIGVLGGKVGPSDFETPGTIPITSTVAPGIPLFMGHYHKHSVIGPGLMYVGALLQHTFGERNDVPGFMLIDKGAKGLTWRRMENASSPRFRVVTCASDLGSVNPGDYVRVSLTSREPEEEIVQEVVKQTGDTSNVRVDIAVEEKEGPVSNYAGMSEKDLLRAWASDNAEEGLDVEECARIGADILREAE